MAQTQIPGYTMGDRSIPKAPLSMQELDLLKQTVTLTEADVEALRMSYQVLEGRIEEVLDVWYEFIEEHDHLRRFFSDAETGEPNREYMDAVRPRFGQWILDTARAEYDQRWLDYQFEIGRRHHRKEKNATDHVEAVKHIAFRYLPALIVPITTTLRPFLAKDNHSAEEVERMHAAWVKSVTLQVILWSYPYVTQGDF
jgi:hypothetical protein